MGLVLEALKNDHMKHGTLTNVALFAAKQVIQSYGRPVPQVVLVLTDGKSNRGLDLEVDGVTYDTAADLLDNNVQVFSIGVGNDTSIDELNYMASNPDEDYVFQVEDYSSLEKIRLKMANNMCNSSKETMLRMLTRSSAKSIGGSEPKEIPEEMPRFGFPGEFKESDMFDGDF